MTLREFSDGRGTWELLNRIESIALDEAVSVTEAHGLIFVPVSKLEEAGRLFYCRTYNYKLESLKSKTRSRLVKFF
jgi:hypothetical protein